MGRFTGALGLLMMLALAYLFSTNRRASLPSRAGLSSALDTLWTPDCDWPTLSW